MADDVRHQEMKDRLSKVGKPKNDNVVEANSVKVLKAKISALSPEERRERYRQMRERLGRSKIQVKCPEGIVACWALKSNEYEMARLQWLGWSIVRERQVKPAEGITPAVWDKRFDAAGFLQDGTYVLGDVILMEIDEETYLLTKEIELDDFEELQTGISQAFKQKAATLGTDGVPTFDVKDSGQKTVPTVQGA